MMTKTTDLIGAALDWAVAKCEGREIYRSKKGRWMTANYGEFNPRHGAPWYEPSTDWAQGGPIIEREVISLIHPKYDCWTAHCYDKTVDDESYTLDGPTPLIAAMRCYVASKLGDEIDVPDELI
jgi:hypothetical protein